MAQEYSNRDAQRLSDLLDVVDAIVWEARPDDLQFTFVNKVAERLLGYPVEDWLEKPGFWAGMIHPDDRERTVKFCLDAIAQGTDHEFEYRAIAADGKTVWLHDVVHVVTDQSGKPTLLRGLMTDVTSSDPEASYQLRDNRELLRAGPLLVDPQAFRAWKDGRLLHLSRTEFLLLEQFLRNLERVLSRDRILDSVWGVEYDGTSNVVDVYVKYLRDKIDEPGHPSLIETVRGVGYRLRSA